MLNTMQCAKCGLTQFEYLAIEGPFDLAAIRQEAPAATATGEALDSLLDMDSGFAIG